MKKRFFALFLAVALLCTSFAALSASAAETYTLDITPATLQTLNGASGLSGKDAASGATWNGVGAWANGTGDANDYLLPFDPDWPHSGGTSAHIVIMNYGNYILIAKNIDLSLYNKVTISYSTDASFANGDLPNELGLMSAPVWFGHDASDKVTDERLIASGSLTESAGDSWNTSREMEIDLSSINYSGDLYLSHFMGVPHGTCVTDITFTLAEGGQGGANPPTGDSSAVFSSMLLVAIMAAVILKKTAFNK